MYFEYQYNLEMFQTHIVHLHLNFLYTNLYVHPMFFRIELTLYDKDITQLHLQNVTS